MVAQTCSTEAVRMAIASTGVTHDLEFRKYHRTTQGIRTLLLVLSCRVQPNRNSGANFRRNLRGTTRERGCPGTTGAGIAPKGGPGQKVLTAWHHHNGDKAKQAFQNVVFFCPEAANSASRAFLFNVCNERRSHEWASGRQPD
jgi:hypothetical protein